MSRVWFEDSGWETVPFLASSSQNVASIGERCLDSYLGEGALFSLVLFCFLPLPSSTQGMEQARSKQFRLGKQ